jgi:hypothetical protein
MSLTPVELGADVVALSMAVSKLFAVVKPAWNKMPRWVAVALPAIVATLPTVAGLFGVVTTTGDVTAAVITSVALVVPGIAEAGLAKPAA